MCELISVVSRLIFFWVTAGSQIDPQLLLTYVEILPTNNMQYELVQKLAAHKNTSVLRAIAESRLECRCLATDYLVAKLSTQKAIKYCRTVESDYPRFQFALRGLSSHPKHKIVGYIQEVASSSSATLKFCAYELCKYKEWDDLVECAKQDMIDHRPILIIQNSFGDLGDHAQSYIRAIDLAHISSVETPTTKR